MKEDEVRRLVRREVDSICKREGGMPPSPYVVIEVIQRLKTVKPWEGLGASSSMGEALRRLVEEITKGVPRIQPPKDPEPEDEMVYLHPREQVERIGAKRHRHVREIPIQEAG